MLLAEVSKSQGVKTLAELPFFTGIEQQSLVQPASLTTVTLNLSTAVEQQVAADAAAAAFITSDYSRSQTVSQLVSSSARCSEILSAHGIGPGSSTAMELSGPGLEAAVGLLGILRSGSSVAFLPAGTTQQQLPSNITALLSTDEDSCIATADSNSLPKASCPPPPPPPPPQGGLMLWVVQFVAPITTADLYIELDHGSGPHSCLQLLAGSGPRSQLRLLAECSKQEHILRLCLSKYESFLLYLPPSLY